MQQSKERLVQFDLIKAFAIILVIVGHTIQYLGPNAVYDSILYRVIYSFHMPLFVMISGYFCKRSLQQPVHEMIIKKARQLLLPVLFGCLLIFVVDVLFFRQFIGIGVVQTHFWFLKFLFVCFCLASFTEKFRNRYLRGFYLLATIVISQLIDWHNINLLYVDFVIGYLLCNISPVITQKQKYSISVSLIVLIIGITIILNGFPSIHQLSLFERYLFIIRGSALSAFIILTVSNIPPPQKKRTHILRQTHFTVECSII